MALLSENIPEKAKVVNAEIIAVETMKVQRGNKRF